MSPLSFCIRTSDLPSPKKSPVPTTCQPCPGLPTSLEDRIWLPFICHSQTSPLSFCIRTSDLPLPVKSPVPATCQTCPGLPTSLEDRIWLPFICHSQTS